MDLLALTLLSLVLVCLFVGYLLYKFTTERYNYWKERNVPFVKPIPFFGNFASVVFFKNSIGSRLHELYNQIQDRFFGIYVFRQPYLVVKDPFLVKQILVKDFNYFRNRTVFSDENIDSLTGNMLFFAKGDKWKTIRTKTSPVFTSGKLKGMSALMEQVAGTLKEYVRKLAEEGKTEDGKDICTRYSMDVLASCAYGVDSGSLKTGDGEFYRIGKRIFGFSFSNAFRMVFYFMDPFLIKLTRMTFLEPIVNQFIRDSLGKTIKEREEANYKRNDLVDFLIEFKKKEINGIKFEGDVLYAQAGQFFVAGHETVSSTMSFALYELCLHPEIQDRLRHEISSAFKDHGILNYEVVHKLPYLDQVVKETLRKYPVLPYLDRRCIKDYRLPDSDFVIEAGTPIYIPMYGLHYDEEYFANPEQFEPSRFSEENRNNIPAGVYFPFGDGPRVCLGERFGLTATKIGLAHLLQEFEVLKCEKTPPGPLEFDTRSITLVPKRKLYFKFKRIASP